MESDGDLIPRNQRRFNRESADRWDLYAPHRKRVTALVEAASPGDGAGLCVLGAGNCNDLDLVRVAGRFERIHLVDLDGDAVESGVRRQGLPAARVHGGVDLTGVAGRLSALAGRDVDTDAAEDLLHTARTAPAPDLGGRFQVVLSACVLTQLADAVANTLGSSHPRSAELALAVRDRHLRLLGELTAPGGTALLVTDTLSSRVAPELESLSDETLREELASRAREGRLFLGTNPAELLSLVRERPGSAATWHRADVTPPWRWPQGATTFLVFALRLGRSA